MTTRKKKVKVGIRWRPETGEVKFDTNAPKVELPNTSRIAPELPDTPAEEGSWENGFENRWFNLFNDYEPGEPNESKEAIKNYIRQLLSEREAKAYERGRKEEADTWINQKANDHDNRIRRELLDELKEKVEGMKKEIIFEVDYKENAEIEIWNSALSAVDSLLDLESKKV